MTNEEVKQKLESVLPTIYHTQKEISMAYAMLESLYSDLDRIGDTVTYCLQHIEGVVRYHEPVEKIEGK
jgi:hypothetical protein